MVFSSPAAFESDDKDPSSLIDAMARFILWFDSFGWYQEGGFKGAFLTKMI
jgi:hypothetical protein